MGWPHRSSVGRTAAPHKNPTVIIDRQPVAFPLSILPPEPAVNPRQPVSIDLKDSLRPRASNQLLIKPPRFRLQSAASHPFKKRQLDKANLVANPQSPPRLIRLTLRHFPSLYQAPSLFPSKSASSLQRAGGSYPAYAPTQITTHRCRAPPPPTPDGLVALATSNATRR